MRGWPETTVRSCGLFAFLAFIRRYHLSAVLRLRRVLPVKGSARRRGSRSAWSCRYISPRRCAAPVFHSCRSKPDLRRITMADSAVPVHAFPGSAARSYERGRDSLGHATLSRPESPAGSHVRLLPSRSFCREVEAPPRCVFRRGFALAAHVDCTAARCARPRNRSAALAGSWYRPIRWALALKAPKRPSTGIRKPV